MRLAALVAATAAFALQVGTAFAGIAPPPVHVPEPTSMAMAAVGVGAVAWAKFRRRR